MVRLAKPAVAALVLAAIVTPSLADVPEPHAAFASPESAAAELVSALQAPGDDRLRAVLGPEADALIDTGDDVEDRNNRQIFLDAYAEKHVLASDMTDRMRLIVGNQDWPFPIPLVKVGDGWLFDSREGAQEIIDRVIGRNEIAAIRVSLAYVDAQEEYFARSASWPGGSRYAEHMLATPGTHDGLYWPAEKGVPESPLGPLVDQAIEEGYPGARESGKQVPYQGYYFRILKKQGPDAPGGAKNFISGEGRMTGGFGLLAWPSRYGASGVMTFQVNQDGVVFQKDLGSDSQSRISDFTMFDSDLSWARVDVKQDD